MLPSLLLLALLFHYRKIAPTTRAPLPVPIATGASVTPVTLYPSAAAVSGLSEYRKTLKSSVR